MDGIVITELNPCMYNYANVNYETREEADAAVLVVKDILDNKPTTWCMVKRITPVGDGKSYLVPADGLSDAEILSLDSDGVYKVSSEFFGDVYENLTATEANAAILTERTRWAQVRRVNEIHSGTYTKYSNENPEHGLFGLVQYMFDPINDPVTPTNADMSGYV
jgi:hypothetical protein